MAFPLRKGPSGPPVFQPPPFGGPGGTVRIAEDGGDMESVPGTLPGQLWYWNGDLSLFTPDAPSNGHIPIWNSVTNTWDYTALNGGLGTVRIMGAPDLDDPNNVGWPVVNIAPIAVDGNTPAVTCRRFDDTNEEGVGFDLTVPSSANNITFTLVHHAQSPPGAATTVQPVFYTHSITGVSPPFSAAIDWTPLSIPAGNTDWIYSSQTFTLTTLGLTAGLVAQFELTRRDAGLRLPGDWALAYIISAFS